MNTNKKSKNCLRCKKELEVINSAYYPFCSQRCKDVDLGMWFKEEYKIADYATDLEDDIGENKEKEFC